MSWFLKWSNIQWEAADAAYTNYLKCAQDVRKTCCDKAIGDFYWKAFPGMTP